MVRGAFPYFEISILAIGLYGQIFIAILPFSTLRCPVFEFATSATSAMCNFCNLCHLSNLPPLQCAASDGRLAFTSRSPTSLLGLHTNFCFGAWLNFLSGSFFWGLVFCCPEQLNRWPCPLVSCSDITNNQSLHNITQDTCDPWDRVMRIHDLIENITFLHTYPPTYRPSYLPS